jgi:predicted GIY-YIG superfamily endonuclease
MWYLYIIKKNARYYTGITTDLKNRLRQHGNPSMLYQEIFSDRFQAAKREKQIKACLVAKKQKLISKSSEPLS